MREVWVKVEDSLSPIEKEKVIEACKQNGCTLLVGENEVEKHKIRDVRVASRSKGDIIIVNHRNLEKIREEKKPLCVEITIENKSCEAQVRNAADKGVDYVILNCPDWKIIPIENIIAETLGKTKLLAKVKDSKEAKLAFETLELGVDGVVITTSDPEEVTETVREASTVETRRTEKVQNSKIDLDLAKITALKQLGIGTRACIDTCDIMVEGEGMLVGSQSSGLFLVHAEVGTDLKSDPRPFRVNAGAVSLYILTPGNRTRYISELSAGDEVLIVDKQGNTRSTIIGRVKIEKRPMILVEAKIDEKTIKTILQNAETIRLVSPEGPKSVTELNTGDEVLVQRQCGGRHFGVLVEEESVIEK